MKTWYLLTNMCVYDEKNATRSFPGIIHTKLILQPTLFHHKCLFLDSESQTTRPKNFLTKPLRFCWSSRESPKYWRTFCALATTLCLSNSNANTIFSMCRILRTPLTDLPTWTSVVSSRTKMGKKPGTLLGRSTCRGATPHTVLEGWTSTCQSRTGQLSCRAWASASDSGCSCPPALANSVSWFSTVVANLKFKI